MPINISAFPSESLKIKCIIVQIFLPFFNFYHIDVCVEDNIFLPLFHVIDFSIVILFQILYILLSFDRQLQGWFLSVIVQISIFIIVGFNSHSLFTSGVNSQDGIFSFLLLEFSICIVIQLKPGKNKYICITDGQNSTIYNRFAKDQYIFFSFFSPFFCRKLRQFCQQTSFGKHEIVKCFVSLTHKKKSIALWQEVSTYYMRYMRMILVKKIRLTKPYSLL